MGDKLFISLICMQFQKHLKPITLLAKENSKAKDLFYKDDFIKEIITLEKDMDGYKGMFKLIKLLKEKNLIKFLFLIALKILHNC